MKLQELVQYLDSTLSLAAFSGDHSNNGLQLEGSPEVRRAAFGVDASLEFFQEGVKRGADFLFVHHGMSWGSQPKRFTGIVAERMRVLFQHNCSLYAVHLPLDAHPELGNNAELCRLIELADRTPYCEYDGVLIGFAGRPTRLEPYGELAARLGTALQCEAKLYGDRARIARRIAVVSGGGGMDALEQAAALGADLLVTGEMTHVMAPIARELNVAVIALGHYASETVGPRAVMEEVRRKFGIETEFIDLPTGL